MLLLWLIKEWVSKCPYRNSRIYSDSIKSLYFQIDPSWALSVKKENYFWCKLSQINLLHQVGLIKDKLALKGDKNHYIKATTRPHLVHKTSKFDMQLLKEKKESEIPKKEKILTMEKETLVKQKNPNFLSLLPHVRSFWLA